MEKSSKGAIPKTRQVFTRSTKTARTPPPQLAEESTYQCESCSIIDNGDKVCCDVCQLWFHFACVNVTSTVANKYWACNTCNQNNRKESTLNKEVGESAVDPSNEAKDIRQTELELPNNFSLIDLESGEVNSSNLEVKDNKSTKSKKTGSTSSSVSRRTTLALQRLEEERQLRNKREEEDRIRRDKGDKEYLDRKYSLLEGESDADLSHDEDLENSKRELIQQWADEVQKEVAADISKENSAEAAHPTAVKATATSESLNFIKPTIPPNWGTQDHQYVKRLNQASSSFAQRSTASDVPLPSWLTDPSTSATETPLWKLPSIQTVMNVLNSDALASEAPPVTSGCVLNRDSQLETRTRVFSSEPMKFHAPNSETSAANISSEQAIGSNAYPVLGSVTVTGADKVRSNWNTQSTMTSTNQEPFLTTQENHRMSIQTSQPRIYQTYPSQFNPINNQLSSFGPQRVPTVISNQPNVGLSVGTYVQPQVGKNFISTIPIASTTVTHMATGDQKGMSTVMTNNIPVLSTNCTNSFARFSNSSVPPFSAHQSNPHQQMNYNIQPQYSSQQNLFGQPSGSLPSLAQINSLNQNFNLGTSNSTNFVPTPSNSLGVASRVRLTAEQIAARHVMPKLPHFFGNPKYWQAFISAFEYSTDACGFSNVENLGRLQECLKGDAHTAVGSRLLHPNAVPAVINTLRLMYGRPELIIESMIEDIKKEPSPRDDDLAGLIKYAISVQNLCGSIEETGSLEHLRNPTLMNVITDKLPTQIQLNWAYYRHASGIVDLSTLGNWLYGLADVASQVARTPTAKSGRKKENDKSSSSNDKSSNSNRSNYLNTQVENKSEGQSSTTSTKSNKCLICRSEACSKITSCKKFKELSRTEKWNFVKERKLCSRCLGGHSFYRCRSTQDCKATGCTKKHHTLLHDYEKTSDTLNKGNKATTPDSKSTDPTTKPPTSSCNSQRSNSNRTDIFRIVPVVLYHKSQVIRDYAYLDDGSNLTIMENGLADEIGLVGTPQSVCVEWAFGQSHESENSRIVSVKISGFYHQAPSYKLDNVRTVNDLHLPKQSLSSTWLDQYAHLKNVPIATYESVKPRMLIGLQYSKLMVSLETIEGSWEEPIACRTRLGWIVQGPSYENDTSTLQRNFSLNLCECQSVDNQLHQLVKNYFSIENFGVKITDKFLESKEVQRARQILEETTMKKNGRYQSGLLWKTDEVNFPNSYNMALKRLQCLESKMKSNPQLAENLCCQIKQFVEKNYVRKMSPSELQATNKRVWYLPIFPVYNPKKPEKVRIVWDAAAKVKNVSLNSMLLTGPDLLVPLVDILRRFRERSIAVLGDIREMYHQIQIIEKDQHAQRFLWRDGDSSKEPEVYTMLVSTFGAACSPCTAQFVKNKNAMEFQESHPEAVAAITKNTYVDDLLECVHHLDEAVQLVKDVKRINQDGGFEIRNFLSNSKELLTEIGERSEQQSKNLNINNDLTLGTERVLGMFWNAQKDNFTYSLKYAKINQNILIGEHRPTKREVLRILMSIFDPLGLLANFLVYAKISLQEIWRSNIEWDEPLPMELQTKLMKWISEINHVETIEIPRLLSKKLSPRTPKAIQLHVFVDASVEAFAAVAYLRIEDEDGVDCSLVGAKTKVAPNKPMSVPRLELQAGVLGTRLAGSIKASQRLSIEKAIYWSDSTTVLGWINSEARRYHQFVAFRIGEILESSDSKEWRWVPSEHNVADEATKSKEIQKSHASSRWYKAPKFLYDDESTWFTEDNVIENYTEEEMRPSFVMTCREIKKVEAVVNVQRFSKWYRLVRSMSYVFRFIHNTKGINRRSGPLLQEEIVKAENYLYRITQRDHYLDEILILQGNAKLPPEQRKELEKSSELFKLSPYLDAHDVLRIRGRLDAAKCLSEETKRPVILPRRHYVTKLIVNHYHRLYKHLNHQTALNEIRQKFDIPALRVVMKEVRNSCQVCKNEMAVPQIPEMAELPLARLAAYERPFTYVGIDYFGPFRVRITRNCTVSRWGVIFTCLTTRAIHLEMAHSLTTNSCIICIENFANLRGEPREFYSDNGTNFHGTENELAEEFKKLNQDQIQEKFTNSEMKWSFNPPVSPHMGGAWERLIRIVKGCLKKTTNTRLPTDETLPALFRAVENIVNSRPLTYVSLESADDEALTPNHFLLGSSNGRKPLCETSPKDLNKNDWKNLQEQTNQFWRRFVLEYMPTLTKRTKWFKQSKPVKVGDIVLIIDERNPRNTWPKGIVEETFSGKGGKRRRAMVRAVLETKKGPVHKLYKRSVHKLAVLDVKVPANEGVNQQPVESINGGETVEQH